MATSDHGQLRNGTAATITGVDPRSGELAIQLASGEELVLDQEQIEQADLRLAYVQHPFPAQGHTTDTAHVIIASQATREGTYVALTRARETTHIYAGQPENTAAGLDRLELLAERVSQTEPEVPSISTPLAHEAAISDRTQRVSMKEPVPTTSHERSREQSELEATHHQ